MRRSLQGLVTQDLVDADAHRAAILYRLNRSHSFASPLLEMLGAATELHRRVAGSLSEWPVPPLHASVFGSTSRGDGDTASDVDLLVVRADPPEQVVTHDILIDALSRSIEQWTGNHAHVLSIDSGQLHEMHRGQDPLLDSWLQDGRLLYGVDLRSLTGKP